MKAYYLVQTNFNTRSKSEILEMNRIKSTIFKLHEILNIPLITYFKVTCSLRRVFKKLMKYFKVTR